MPDPARPIDRRLVLLLAVTCGAAVANLYYPQPLLDAIARALDVGDAAAGALVTVAQVGYVVGLLLLVPLGDLVDRRRLIVLVLLAGAATQVVAASAPSFAVLAAATTVVGVTAAVAQVVVPLAASLAAEEERGRVVGTVMSGLLIGILAARTVSGALAELGGWRLVLGVSSGAMVLLAAVLWRALPSVPGASDLRYPALLRSVGTLIREERLLRERMWIGATLMAGFSALWTAIAFLLAREPYGYSEAAIGLFGLAGLAGAAIAPVAGRLADGGRGSWATTAFLTALPASWVLLELGGRSVLALIAGIVLFDLGVQGGQISNQSAIYALRPEARSRITTAYIVAYFLGGVAGSLGGATTYGAGGWDAVCALGGGVSLVGLASWAWVQRRARRPAPATASGAPTAR